MQRSAKERFSRHALTFATLAYVLGWSAHTTFVFYLAPIALRQAGAVGLDAWVFSGTAIASVLAVLPSGRLTDRFPRRRVLRASLALLGLAYVPLIVLPPSFAGVLVATLVTGTGFAMLFVSFNAYVPDLLAQRPMSSAYARSSAYSTLASAAGPFVAALVFEAFMLEGVALRTNSALFLLVGFAGAGSTLLLPPAGHVRAPSTLTGGRLRDVLRAEWPNALPSIIVYGFLGAGYGATMPYFAVFFLDHVMASKETWGYLLAAATFSSAIGALAAGRLAGPVSPRLLVLGPQAVLVLVSFLFLAPLPVLALGAAFVLRNLFSTTTGPMVNTMLMPRVQPDARGRVQALGTLAWNVGWAGGAAVGGMLLVRLSGGLFPLGAMFGLAGVAAGIALIARER